MNIKELMEWRHDCFFCGEELTLFPTIGGLTATFSIEENFLVVKSQFVNLSIHIETGEVCDKEKDKVTVDEFLRMSQLKITAKCISCEGSGRLYQYYGSITQVPSLDRTMNVSMLREEVMIINDWIYGQQKLDIENGPELREWGHIKTFKKNVGEGPPSVVDILSADGVRTPFLDLKKLTPEKLENKLKTYLIFS
jgi:hypothetical protein